MRGRIAPRIASRITGDSSGGKTNRLSMGLRSHYVVALEVPLEVPLVTGWLNIVTGGTPMAVLMAVVTAARAVAVVAVVARTAGRRRTDCQGHSSRSGQVRGRVGVRHMRLTTHKEWPRG